MKLIWLGVAACAVACSSPSGASPVTARSFEGVWTISKFVRTGANAMTDLHPQPCITIFTRGYYAIVRDNTHGTARREAAMPRDRAKPTDAEKIAKYDEWAPFAASAGTYEVKGDTLVTRNVIAKQVRGVGLVETARFRFEGNRFIVTSKSDPGEPASEVEVTYTRLR